MAKDESPKTSLKKTSSVKDAKPKQARFLLFSVILIAGILLGLLGYGVLSQNVLTPNQAVARVNDQDITLKDFQKYAKFTRVEEVGTYQQLSQYLDYYQQLGIQPDPQLEQQISTIQQEMQDTNAFGQKVLNYMIDDAMFVAEAKNMGITISQDDVTKMFQDTFGYFPQGTPTLASTPTEYIEPTLSKTQIAMMTAPTSTPDMSPTATSMPLPTNPAPTAVAATVAAPTATNGPTPTMEPTPTELPSPTPITEAGYAQLMKNYMTQLTPYGLTEADLRQYVYYQLLYNKIYTEVTKNVPTHGEQVWTRQILVNSEADAQTVITRLNKGENWVVLAEELSQDTNTKSNGGDMGWLPRGTLSMEVETAAFGMTIGEVRSIQDSNGWHVLQVVGHDQDRPLDQNVLAYLQDKSFNDWHTTTKGKTTIQTFDVWKANVPTAPALPNQTGSTPTP